MIKTIYSLAITSMIMAICSFSFRAKAAEDAGVYTIEVKTPGILGQTMVQKVENWSDVKELIIKGSINQDDMSYFSRLLSLQKLDLSCTDITEIVGCKDLKDLHTVILPETINSIGEGAFDGCFSLAEINLDNVTAINSSAFYKCISLSGTLNLSKVVTIGRYAFSECDNIVEVFMPHVINIEEGSFYGSYENKLESVNMAEVKSIGSSAFHQTNIRTVEIPNCLTIGESCFAYCRNLNKVVLSDNLEIISNSVFNNSGITEISLPLNLKSIESNAFDGCRIENITLPSKVEYIGRNAFSFRYTYFDESDYVYKEVKPLKNVYCLGIVPIETEAFNSDYLNETTLHVPSLSVAAYRLDEHWYKFGTIKAIDGVIDDVTIVGDFSIIDTKGLADKTNLTLSTSQYGSAHLSIFAPQAISLGSYQQYQDYTITRKYIYDDTFGYRYIEGYPFCTSLVNESEIRADNVTTKMALNSGRWSFISLPYDVKVCDIKVSDDALWVLRKYNGANRASMNNNTWEDLDANSIMKAGEGYIIHCVNNNNNEGEIQFVFPAINNSLKNNIFASKDVTVQLNEYPSEFIHNRGWNLIGNPYPSFFNIKDMDFDSPITVWNASEYTYNAISTNDDEYNLLPNEAFFVQASPNNMQVRFKASGRNHDWTFKDDNRRYVSANKNDKRKVFNLSLSSDEYRDRTRIVINDEASVKYEITCDASKFMSSNNKVPQIYINDGGIRYSIDERPLENGLFDLGMHIGYTGVYTLSLTTIDNDYDLWLTDNEFGCTVNLKNESYEFTANQDDYSGRFSLLVEKNDFSGIENLENNNKFIIDGQNVVFDSDNSEICIISTDGRIIYKGISNTVLTLLPGIYIISINDHCYKAAIK